MTGQRDRIGLLAVGALLLSGCSFGPTELLIILAIALLLFGATRLPQLGKAVGETVKNFRKSSGIDAVEEGKKNEVVKIEEAKVEPADEPKDSQS